MSGNDTGSGALAKGARVLLGGLAGGAILSTAIAAHPAAAAEAAPAGVSAAVTEPAAAVPYFAEQFSEAFTPGAISTQAVAVAGVIIRPPDSSPGRHESPQD
ncbi:hypothetical protein [Actinoplanes sp. NPDC049118]|uniref:hypothetical protein n=1 Tax=Actinoplanes sp. NPDC049118 TaxID=3155769 RepID=UPI00340388F0